jgi:hypothetical protein
MIALPPALLAVALLQCVFQPFGPTFVGSCGKLFNQMPGITLVSETTTAITTGVWRKDMTPVSVWNGEMTDQGYGKAPVELEIYAGGWGILRTIYAWVPVSGFELSSNLSFRVDAPHEVAPNALDRQIVQRASAILTSESVWNRTDNRKCPAAATKWSLYCAMERAAIEVTGGFSHRRPALEVVRVLVEQKSAGRQYEHRLMDWNNDPRTHLSDVQNLLAEALRRMSDAAWLSSQGFVPVPPGGFQR